MSRPASEERLRDRQRESTDDRHAQGGVHEAAVKVGSFDGLTEPPRDPLRPRPLVGQNLLQVPLRPALRVDGGEASIVGVPKEQLVRSLATEERPDGGNLHGERERHLHAPSGGGQPTRIFLESSGDLEHVRASHRDRRPRRFDHFGSRRRGLQVWTVSGSNGREGQAGTAPQFPG